MAEFMEGSKQDSSIIQALSLYDGNEGWKWEAR